MRFCLLLSLALACVGCSDDGAAGDPMTVDRFRSLVWTDEAILDDPEIISLSFVMRAVSDDGHGGALIRDWFNTFSTTSHSERLGPALLIEELSDEFGNDPTLWDLELLPFRVTAVHNRIDLGPRNGACGELRVSFASTHPIYSPFHIIFLFRQPLADGDTEARCEGTARRWAELSELEHSEFVDHAATLLEETISPDNFVLAESVELTVSPWEWRQWRGLENPALFQTVDSPRLNLAGPLRDDFIAFATDNADGLMARTVAIPARFRPFSVQVPPTGGRETLNLDVPGYPGLAREIEIVGCPACHTDNADFVHTSPQRVFSAFYDLELDARATYLEALSSGVDVAIPPFGPLQTP